MNLRIVKEQLDQFKSGAMHMRSKEMCGMLTGPRSFDDVAIVTTIHGIRNIAIGPSYRFKLDPQEYYDVLKTTDWIDDNSLATFSGIIHSHPWGPSTPSPVDRQAAKDGQVSEGVYIIYNGRTNTFNFFYLKDTVFHKIKDVEYI